MYGKDLDGNVSADANGIHVKTDKDCGGLVKEVTYENTCMYGVKHLITVNAYYGSCSGTSGTPRFQDILVNGALSQAGC